MKAICAYDLNGLPVESFRRLMGSHHVFAAPLTERQLSYLSHFIPSLEVDEISYHVGKFEETKLKLIRKEGVGYLFCETPIDPLMEKMDIESLVDKVADLLVHGA